MSSIDIQKIAKLLRLRIEDDKLAEFERDMESIIAMADMLPDIAEEHMSEPTAVMELREDKAAEPDFSREELFANAPKVHAGCLAVPKTVE